MLLSFPGTRCHRADGDGLMDMLDELRLDSAARLSSTHSNSPGR